MVVWQICDEGKGSREVGKGKATFYCLDITCMLNIKWIDYNGSAEKHIVDQLCVEGASSLQNRVKNHIFIVVYIYCKIKVIILL